MPLRRAQMEVDMKRRHNVSSSSPYSPSAPSFCFFTFCHIARSSSTILLFTFLLPSYNSPLSYILSVPLSYYFLPWFSFLLFLSFSTLLILLHIFILFLSSTPSVLKLLHLFLLFLCSSSSKSWPAHCMLWFNTYLLTVNDIYLIGACNVSI
jgi:hypothetical protein